ncbi:PREDICTED: WAT1-related protein At1g01070 [Tarenaya hassleriana]|uniref:WAT1-related protein At1g01070 n=1 Tax=Tarenaya hassleriana TaxID=28532 RepID=UPI00053C7701|nr:PREDICTED: WAT1-related protein At1g01070 [Tarenaya hassleriana]
MGENGVEQWGTVTVMVLTNVAMGSVNALVKKVLDGGINHMVVAAYRLAISALILAPFAHFCERKIRPKLTFRILCEHFISGLLGASLTQFFFLLGLSYTSATVSCAIISMLPAVTFTLALIFRSEILNLKSKGGLLKVLGTLISISGALLLTFYKGVAIANPHSQSEGSSQHHDVKIKTQTWLVGCLFLLIGTTTLSFWLLFQAKINIKYPCKYSSTFLMSVFATFQCALLSLIKTRDVQHWIIKDKFVILVIVYSGVVGQAMSTVATSWGIKKRGPVFASTFYPVMLISATLFDFIVLHRHLYLGSILGSAVAIAGLYVFLWGKNKDVEAVSAATKLSSQNESNEIAKTVPDHNNNSDDDTRLPV